MNLVVGGPLVSHVEIFWEHPLIADWYERLGGFARCLMFDRRGTGASDPVQGAPSLDQQMDDLLAVLDAADFGQTALLGTGDVARMMALFAGTFPDRVSSLVLNGPAAAGSDGLSPELVAQLLETWRTRGEPARASDSTHRPSPRTKHGFAGARALSEWRQAP